MTAQDLIREARYMAARTESYPRFATDEMLSALADALEAAMRDNKRLNDLLQDRDWKLNRQAEILGRMEAKDVENYIRIQTLDDENTRLKYLMNQKEQEALDEMG